MDPVNEREINYASDPIDVVVYMHDNSGIMLSVPPNTQADHLFEMLLSEMKVGGSSADLYRNTFSLWLVSDLLELQLKATHVPFKLVCFWEELLEKYVHCREEDEQRDEPMLMFQRNVYLSKQQELQIQDTEALALLYHEARKRNVQGRYPLELDVAEECAVLQALVMEAKGEEGVGSPSFFLEHLKDMMAARHCRRHWLWKRSQNPEQRLCHLYQTKKDSLASPPSLHELYTKYLVHCHKVPSYGGAFLHSQVENPLKKFDEQVHLCISLRGLCVINCQEQVLLAYIPMERLSWQYAESSKNRDSNSLPCLFVLFPQVDNNNAEVSKLLQVFSKSAILADNLIETLISLKQLLKITATQEELQIYVDEKKLALAVFDENGKKTTKFY